MPSTAFRWTLPPRPPSPPSGPPKGTNFSRRKLTQPRPPLPACTLSLASSMNFMDWDRKLKRGTGVACSPQGFERRRARAPAAAGLLRNDVDVRALFRTFDAKLDDTVRRRKQRMVSAHADVHTRTILSPALADEDIAREHILSAELLDTQAFRVRVAAVASAAAGFFMCHSSISSMSLRDDLRDLHIGIGLPVGLFTL